MRRRGCIDCRLIEETPGQWIKGRCPRCNQLAEMRVRREQQAASAPPPKLPPRVIPTPEYVRRPLVHLASVGKRYPQAWQWIDKFRAERESEKEGFAWPSWCFCPLSGAYAIVTGGRDVTPSGVETSVVGALAAWRVTQGIYRFDPTLLDELWETPVTGDIPVEILERLPAWCCYIPFETPRHVIRDNARGFFVHQEYDMGTGRRELRFLLDFDLPHEESVLKLQPMILHLTGNLTDCLTSAFAESRKQALKHGYTEEQYKELMAAAGYSLNAVAEATAHEIAPLVSLTLYLCSTSAEILGRDGQNKPLNRPVLRHTKRGTRMFPPQQPEEWQVGFRLGATLRAAAPHVSGPDRGGTHVGPKPHLRRAHWHAFWTGPKAKPGREYTDRKLVLKWLHPILVGSGEVVPVVHRVTT